MVNLISILLALLALPFILIGLIPIPIVSPVLNVLGVGLAVVGVAVGVLSSSNTGRNLNIIVAVVGGFRLWLGGFFF